MKKSEMQELINITDNLTSIKHSLFLQEELQADLEEQIERIKELTKPLRDEQYREMVRRMDISEAQQEEMGLRAVWCLDEGENLDELHPYTAREMSYHAHFTGQDYKVPIEGPTWRDLWIAGDKLIKQAQNGGHIFIEYFVEKDGVLELGTGS